MSEQDGLETRRSVGAQRNQNSTKAILDAAERLLCEEGYGAFSIEKVAKYARAGKPTIYRWWPNKTALLLDVYMRQKQIRYPDSGNLEEDLFQFVTSIFQFWRNTSAGEIFRSAIAEAQTDTEAGVVFAKFAKDRRRDTSGIIIRAQRRGEVLPSVDPELVADWIASWLWSHLLTQRLEDDTARPAIRMLLHGIKDQKSGHK